MKASLLLLFSVIFLTDAVEVNDEDINSPLVSYLLAKVQRLEAKMRNTTCPYGANTIYKGTAVGGRYDKETSPSNLMCLPYDTMDNPSRMGPSDSAYAVEYRVGGILDHANCRNMPCALCEATGRNDKIMIPSHYVCPDGWHKEYNGYIMAGEDGHHGGCMYYCVDEALEQVKGSGTCENAHFLYLIGAYRAYVPTTSYALSCVVCTK